MSYFTRDELKCKHCGEYKFDDDFLNQLNVIREECGWPFHLTSAYRCPDHPIEARKDHAGAHTFGCAVDVRCHGEKALQLIRIAQDIGIKRIGINQNGPISGRFIHIDTANEYGLPSPSIWSY
jgi:uncharacterized protein YcbK (DUF882 family)